ncbi:MAG: hypothetical protein ABI847_05440 [Anaerolineales bacterium]
MRSLWDGVRGRLKAMLHDLFAESAGPHLRPTPDDPLAERLAETWSRLAALEAQVAVAAHAANDAAARERSEAVRARLTELQEQYQRLAAEARQVRAREQAGRLHGLADNTASGLEAQLAERAEALARRADVQAARDELARESRQR